jgi:SNF2 family DNA or RNA helicase
VRYKFKITPFAHQKDAIRKLVSTGFGGALLMDPRTGKTKTTIDYFCIMHLAGKVERVLITCPLAVIGVWEEEIEKNVPDNVDYRITIWDKEGRKAVGLPKWTPGILDIVLINHDAFAVAGAPIPLKRNGKVVKDQQGRVVWTRSKRRGGRYEMKNSFNLWQPHMIVIDESHRFKSSSSAKWRIVFSLCWKRTPTGALENKIPYRVMLTGTAVTKKKRIFDLWAQWRILNPQRFRGMTLEDFKHHYGRWVHRGGKVVDSGRRVGGYDMWIGNRAHEVEKLRKAIHRDSFAITRDECFDLPKQTHQLVPVELTHETQQLYVEMAEEMIAKLKSGEITEASIALVQSMRLAQIASGVARTKDKIDENGEIIPGKLVRVSHEKQDALESLLYDLFEAEEKVVVASRFTHDLQMVEAICKKLKVPCFTLQGRRKAAGQSRTQRDADRRKFQSMDGPACYAVQPQSGSMGIDLSAAGTEIWISLTSSWVDYTQMKDRIALNPNNVSILYLCAAPIDYLLYETLQEDGNVARAILDSPDRLLRNYKAPSQY